jgi:predicted DNA-binding transcriptional regulator YafY
MARKRTAPAAAPAPSDRPALTAERFLRLHRLLHRLARGPQNRDDLAAAMHLDVRGFYRDLEVLRLAGIPVLLERGRYRLGTSFDAARTQLPLPDPLLTLGEALLLAKGRTAAHRRLRALVTQLTA